MASVLAIVGGIALSGGLVGTLLEVTNHNACDSGLGQVGQAFSEGLTRQCGLDNGIFYTGLVAAVVGVVLIVAALVVGAQRYPLGPRANQRQAPPSPPGWYPDPSGVPQMRWWDGGSWGAQSAPHPPASPTPD